MSKNILQRKRILTKAGGGSSISTPVSVANGGTGISSYAIGDIIYASGTTTLSKLAIGTANQQLRVNAGATALEYFTPTGSGITVGTTTITSGTSTRVAFNDGGVYGEDADLTWNKTTNILTATGGFSTGSLTFKQTINNNIIIGGTTSTGPSTIVISSTGIGASGCDSGVIIGEKAGIGGAVGNHSTLVGFGACRYTATGVGGIGIGRDASPAHNATIVIAYGATTTSTNQGILGAPTATGYISDWYFNGVTHTAPYSVVLNASGGSGTNNAGANITIATGRGTGNVATGGDFIVQTSDVGASSSTAQTLTTKFTVKKSGSIEVTKSINTTSGDSATIDKVAGRFRKDNSGTTFTLTNALITANSIILLTPIQVDLTAMSWGVAAGAGSCVITFNAAPTADFDMNFLIIN